MAEALVAPGPRAAGHAAAPVRPVATCILVAGMHRSGTSAVTQTLHRMGAALPSDPMTPNQWNPDGFYESKQVCEAHERFLRSIGWAWHTPMPIPSDALTTRAAADCRAAIAAFLSRELGATSLLAVKDPRICLLMPIWRDLLDEMGVETHVVLTARNPFDVAKSLEKRNHFARAHVLTAWLVHSLSAEWSSRELPRAFAVYEDFLDDPVDATVRLSEQLGCFDEATLERAAPSIAATWNPALRHHRSSDDGGEDDAAAGAIASTYRWHLAAAQGREPPRERLDANWNILADILELSATLAFRPELAPRRSWSRLLRGDQSELARYRRGLARELKVQRR